MRTRRSICLTVLVAVSALVGCTRDFSLPGAGEDQTAPTLSAILVTPAFARDGAVIEVRFGASEVLPEGSATAPNPRGALDGTPMSCGAEGDGYLCTLAVTSDLDEGLAELVLGARDLAGNDTGELPVAESVVIDRTPPAVAVQMAQRQVTPGGTFDLSVIALEEPLGEVPTLGADHLASGECLGAAPGVMFACSGTLAADAPVGPMTLTLGATDRAGNAGEATGTIEVEVPLPSPEIVSVEPNPVPKGEAVTVQVRDDAALEQCLMSIAGQIVACEVTGNTATCVFPVPVGTADGTYRMAVDCRNASGWADAVSPVVVDSSPPILLMGLLHLERTPDGLGDRIVAKPGAALDVVPNYPGQAVTRIEILPDGGVTSLATVVPNADGSFEVDLSGADIDCGAEPNPALCLWFRIVDVAGNWTQGPLATTVQVSWQPRRATWHEGLVSDPAVRSLFHMAAAPNALAGPALAETTGVTTLGAGDLDAPDGTTATWTAPVPGATPLTWTQRSPITSPSARRSSAMAYDRVRREVILFGGVESSGSLGVELNDTWRWDGTDWTLLDPANKPAPRFAHGLTWDPIREAVVLIGGKSSPEAAAAATWAWDGTDWTMLGDLPTARAFGTAVWHPHQRRVIYHGGENNSGNVVGSAFVDSTGDVSADASFGPVRGRYGATFDPIRDTLWLYGGTTTSGRQSSWYAWVGDRFSSSTLLGTPGARNSHRLFYDPWAGTLHVIRGWDGFDDVTNRHELYDGTTPWASVTVSRPTARAQEAGVWDPVHREYVMFGGNLRPTLVDDTWVLSTNPASPVRSFGVFTAVVGSTVPNAFDLTITAGGRGDNGDDGTPDDGLEVYAWSRVDVAWTSLGTMTGGPGALETATFGFPSPTSFVSDTDQVRVLLVAPPTSAPGGSIESQLVVDAITLDGEFF